MATGPLVRAAGVERTFGSGSTAVRALRGVSLEIEGGRLTALKGRSGSGKTTLLNILGGLDRPNAGEVYFDDRDITKLSEAELTRIRLRSIGYVFQSFGLMPLLSARENVELPLRMAGIPHKERRERSEKWLTYVGLEKRMKHRPYELSGGEQQRTALARALAMEPRLILADEPTGELDTATSAQVLDLLKRVTRETGVAICLTTHDPAIMERVDVVYGLVDGRLAREEQ